MNLAQQIGKVYATKEASGFASEFAQVARIMATYQKPFWIKEAEREKLSPRLIEHLKAAVEPNTMAGAGSDLAQSSLATAFLSSLTPNSLFDLMFPNMLQAPLNTSIVAVTTNLTATNPAEANVKTLSKLVLAGNDL